MKEVSAELNIQVWVDCPYCCRSIDLMDHNDHNTEGHVINQATPSGVWYDEHPKFEINHIECCECKETFKAKGLNW